MALFLHRQLLPAMPKVTKDRQMWNSSTENRIFLILAVNGVNAAAPMTPQQPILTAQHIVTTVIPLGPHSTHTICPSCGCEMNTKTRTSPGLIAYVSGFLIAVFGCWLGCCLVCVQHHFGRPRVTIDFVCRFPAALMNAWTFTIPVQDAEAISADTADKRHQPREFYFFETQAKVLNKRSFWSINEDAI